MSAAKPHLFAAIGASLMLTPMAVAGSQEQAVRDLARIEDGLRSGTVVTAISEAAAGGNRAIERCTFSADSIRVDAIMGFEPGKPLVNPTVVVQISTPAGKVSASIALRGQFAGADAVFDRLDAKPQPEVRKLEGDQPITARALQVLGWTGSGWLSRKLGQAGDATVSRKGDEELIGWGQNQPLRTQIHLIDNSPFLAGYEYFPGPNNHAFTEFSIRRQPTAKGALASFEKVTAGSEADEKYELSILKFEHKSPPRDFFVLTEPEHSLVNSVSDPESVSRIVDGKRVKHYRAPNPNAESSNLVPILGLVTGGLALVACSVMLVTRGVKRP